MRRCRATAPFVVLLAAGAWADAPSGPSTTECSEYEVIVGNGGAIDPGTAIVPGSGCDDCLLPVSLPFAFPFYGEAFSSVNVSSNGTLQFASTFDDNANLCLPVVTLNGAIAPYWDDLLLTGVLEGVFTSTEGFQPQRIFNIEWRGGYLSGAGTVNFEVRLFETKGRIDFIYGFVNQGIASATGGLQKGNGTAAFETLFCNGSGQNVGPGTHVTYICGMDFRDGFETGTLAHWSAGAQ